jgi:hypothetical protein
MVVSAIIQGVYEEALPVPDGDTGAYQSGPDYLQQALATSMQTEQTNEKRKRHQDKLYGEQYAEHVWLSELGIAEGAGMLGVIDLGC